uniref:Uncharacterized protein n=1 Tax=Ditylenchus dipsaci TaxID=166011 RepID=A0A915DZ18_9BILA
MVGKQNQHKRELDGFRDRIQEAKAEGNNLLIQQIFLEQRDFMLSKGIRMGRQLMVLLLNGGVFMAQFLAIRKMVVANYPGLSTGGVGWFTDLTAADPYYILPAASALTIYLVAKVGIEFGTSANQMSPLIRMFLQYGMPAFVLVLGSQFSSGVTLYWVTSNSISLIYAGIFHIPAIRNALGIPLLTTYPVDANKKNSLNEFLDNRKTTKNAPPRLEDIKKQDAENFKKAGRGQPAVKLSLFCCFACYMEKLGVRIKNMSIRSALQEINAGYFSDSDEEEEVEDGEPVANVEPVTNEEPVAIVEPPVIILSEKPLQQNSGWKNMTDNIPAKPAIKTSSESLAFVPFTSFIDPTFWSQVNKLKVNKWQLDETPKKIFGTYSTSGRRQITKCSLCLSHDSFVLDESVQPVESQQPITPKGESLMVGQLLLVNTRKAFLEELDRKAILESCAQKLWSLITSKEWLTSPTLLNNFCLTAWADIKQFTYYYWNCMPVLLYPNQIVQNKSSEVLTEQIFNLAVNHLDKVPEAQNNDPFVIINRRDCHPLSAIDSSNDVQLAGDVLLVFPNPSSIVGQPGWPLRNLLSAIAYLRKDWTCLKVLALRRLSLEESYIIEISWDRLENQPDKVPKGVGWERDLTTGALSHKIIELKSMFDPLK